VFEVSELDGRDNFMQLVCLTFGKQAVVLPLFCVYNIEHISVIGTGRNRNWMYSMHARIDSKVISGHD